jgi:hypothetical protein
MNMPTPVGLSTRLLRTQNRPAKQYFGGLTVFLSLTAFSENKVYPEVLSKRSLHLVNNASISRANYTAIAQSRDEVMMPDNSPSVSMWPYLIKSVQTEHLPKISVYAHRGTSRDRARLLYMNAGALALWQEMGKTCTVIGEFHRPPWNAALSFGMPFSE